jgi:hypothetical protein
MGKSQEKTGKYGKFNRFMAKLKVMKYQIWWQGRIDCFWTLVCWSLLVSISLKDVNFFIIIEEQNNISTGRKSGYFDTHNRNECSK